MSQQTEPTTETRVSADVADAWITALSNLVAVRSPLSGPLADRLAGRADFTPAQRLTLDRLVPWARRIAEPAAGPGGAE